jgi:periplasmic protein TonB
VNDYLRLAICLVGAAIFEVALADGLQQLPPQKDPSRTHKISITVQEKRVEPEPPPPEPEPPKPPPPKPEVKPQVVHEAPRPTPQKQAEQPKATPPPDQPPPPGPTTDEPVFGVSMDSTSQAGTGPVMNVGNTTHPQPNKGSAAAPQKDVKPLGEPVAAYQATKMPLPQGNCSGKYNDEALAAGIEGTVVLDLVVGEDGHVREVSVVQGIGHGLDEAASAALRTCKFTPGEKDGQPVAVKIKGFKIRFVLPEHE